ncbi:uncharacterized protein BYT42DRAFT_611695 [Radiomyces spectabilis]|uniref:uncharacterized protein n=1 Tax=Radiomyces spectabilis TaxID=64574 RepID=UPI00221EBF0F|nr:uncharacterized protein BYT42DRAFT_611695 [Radiomyces spectabilis]KAI8388682.1 hypothetical protein BYT42DRAFT_611695 [Radiomyces spectabilis]
MSSFNVSQTNGATSLTESDASFPLQDNDWNLLHGVYLAQFWEEAVNDYEQCRKTGDPNAQSNLTAAVIRKRKSEITEAETEAEAEAENITESESKHREKKPKVDNDSIATPTLADVTANPMDPEGNASPSRADYDHNNDDEENEEQGEEDADEKVATVADDPEAWEDDEETAAAEPSVEFLQETGTSYATCYDDTAYFGDQSFHYPRHPVAAETPLNLSPSSSHSLSPIPPAQSATAGTSGSTQYNHPQESASYYPQTNAVTSGQFSNAFGDLLEDALSHLMMSWYYCGYYTGLYQANRQ